MNAWRILGSTLTCLLLAAASAEADEEACSSARYKALGKYQQCQGRLDLSQDGAYRQGYLKCRQKYDTAYARMSNRFAATSCEGPRFVDNGDGTVTDNLTRLVWESKSDVSGPHYVYNTYRWSADGDGDADGTLFSDLLDGMNSTCYAGHCDWRVPTEYELNTILHPVSCTTDPCVADPLLLPMRSSVYVSASGQGFALAGLGFDDGDGYALPKYSGPWYFRVVRGGL